MRYKCAQGTLDQASFDLICCLTTRMVSAVSRISNIDKAVSDAKSSTAIQLIQIIPAFLKVQTELVPLMDY